MPNVDPTIKALASTIGQLETGSSSPDAYTVKGQSGEYGRYQMMPNTQKVYFKRYVGDANAAPTIENQNKAVYGFIQDKKSQGYNPAQIMSMWNAGEGSPDVYKQNHRGVNSAGVAYDTTSYVQRGSQIYNEKKGQTQIAGQQDASAPQLQPEQNLGQKLAGRLGDAGNAVSDALSGKEAAPLISAPLQVAGAAAGAVGDTIGAGLNLIPGVKQAEDLVGKGVAGLANTGIGQRIVRGAQITAQEHPELAKDVGAGLNIAGLVGGGIGGTAVKDIAGQGIKGVVEKGLASAGKGAAGDAVKGLLEKSATKRIAASASELSQKELENNASRVLPSGALVPSNTESRAGELLAGRIGKNPVKNLATVNEEIKTLGKGAETHLEQNSQPIANGEDFNAFNTVKTDSKKYMTPSEAKAYDEQVNVFQKILKGYGKYTTPNYYKALKEYETQVTSKLPKGKMALLAPEGTAKLQAARDVRKVVRDMIASKHPEFSDKMFDLASLYDAKDTMAGRVAKFAKEGGKSGLVGRAAKFVGKHALKYGLEGAGFGAVTHLIQ